MSRKGKNQLPAEKPEVEKESGYYDLKTKAVQDLIEANAGNAPEVSEEELRKYRSQRGFRIPDAAKCLFVKAWFAGAVCFFFIWGLAMYMADMLDTLLVTGIALGIVTDLLTNNVLRFFARTTGAHDCWMMYPKKGYASFPLNILHAYVILAGVLGIYTGLNMLINAVAGLPADTIVIGVEPILFGVFAMVVDQICIFIKHRLTDALRGTSLRAAGNAAGT